MLFLRLFQAFMYMKLNKGFATAIISIMVIIFCVMPTQAVAMTIETGYRSLFFGPFGFFTKAKASVSFDTMAKPVDETIKKAEIIDTYFRERSMPLAGMGMVMMVAAETNNLDWRLLPAIAIRESSGGKYACDKNPFGWASCKVDFESIEDAIQTVAWNLGGNNPKTKQYYISKDTSIKLFHYNGTVITPYPDQVLRIMKKIEDDQD